MEAYTIRTRESAGRTVQPVIGEQLQCKRIWVQEARWDTLQCAT